MPVKEHTRRAAAMLWSDHDDMRYLILSLRGASATKQSSWSATPDFFGFAMTVQPGSRHHPLDFFPEAVK
jgi:hypothetical protein